MISGHLQVLQYVYLRVHDAGGPRVFLNIEDHNSFNDPHGPTFNADLHVSRYTAHSS